MIDFILLHSGVIMSVLFFSTFTAIALWSYWPSNKERLQSYGHIPLMESDDGR